MLKQNYKIIGIVTCYNRVNSTRLFLDSFFDLIKSSQVDLKLYLLDDGSNDGTSEMISEQYPSVQLIKGHGGNYWAGGMRLIFQKIDKSDFTDYTHLFVLNDDIVLKKNALLDTLNELENSNWSNPLMPYTAVLNMFDEELGRVVYGGLMNQSRFGGFIYNVLEPVEKIIMAETLNMNAALISRGAINQIGFLDVIFAHHRADIDFGLRLNNSGGKVLVIPGIHGVCTLNSYRSFNYFSEKNLYRRIKMVIHPKNEPFLERFIFYWRHSNFFGLIFFLNPYLTVFFPFLRYSFLKNRILVKQKRSN
jgi:GT2 family glycosyltransferase